MLTDEQIRRVICPTCTGTGIDEVYPYDAPPIAQSCGDCDGTGVDVGHVNRLLTDAKAEAWRQGYVSGFDDRSRFDGTGNQMPQEFKAMQNPYRSPDSDPQEGA